MSKTLGKLRQPGECFLTTTKQQIRWERHENAPYHLQAETPRVVTLNPGFRGFFTNGKREYYCEVLALVETRVGWLNIPFGNYNPEIPIDRLGIKPWRRWWQFTYLVRIIEN